MTNKHENMITMSIPEPAWNTLFGTLGLDMDSGHVDPELRAEIREAMERIEFLPDPKELLAAARDVLAYGEERPADLPATDCWRRLRDVVREAAGQVPMPEEEAEPEAKTEDLYDDSTKKVTALRQVFDLLYLDMGPKGDFYNPDKAWDADTLDRIADVVRPLFRLELDDSVNASARRERPAAGRAGR